MDAAINVSLLNHLHMTHNCLTWRKFGKKTLGTITKQKAFLFMLLLSHCFGAPQFCLFYISGAKGMLRGFSLLKTAIFV